jgi:hypothetical protein
MIDVPLEAIRTIALADQDEDGTPFTCDITCKHVRDLVLPWSLREFGHYKGPDLDRGDPPDHKPYGHHWLRLEDGTIVDPTANQFGEPDVVRVVPVADPRQAWYTLVIDDVEYQTWGNNHPAAVAFAVCRREGFRRASWV